ncbi:MAG: hypothetical protein J7L69_01445 [Desulfobulbaceae bacterium]|nr:hypothetical protein [Desulfobulbaceae bacterium]
MEGAIESGWYDHPNLGLIKIFMKGSSWAYQCYSKTGKKSLSRERDLDQWIWALSEPVKMD